MSMSVGTRTSLKDAADALQRRARYPHGQSGANGVSDPLNAIAGGSVPNRLLRARQTLTS
jgi:hypothetical protein